MYRIRDTKLVLHMRNQMWIPLSLSRQSMLQNFPLWNFYLYSPIRFPTTKNADSYLISRPPAPGPAPHHTHPQLRCFHRRNILQAPLRLRPELRNLIVNPPADYNPLIAFCKYNKLRTIKWVFDFPTFLFSSANLLYSNSSANSD